MANAKFFSDQKLMLDNLWRDLHSVRPELTADDLQRARPVLFNHLLDHVLDNGDFAPEDVAIGEVCRYYSFIPEEMDMRKSDYAYLYRVMDKTIELGLMDTDYTWFPDVTKTQIALWVTEMAKRLHIKRFWKWAYERWEIENLKAARSSTMTRYGAVKNEMAILACFEVNAYD